MASGVYNISCSLRNCVRVAQQTLTLFVWVRILVPQPKNPSLRTWIFSFMSAGHNFITSEASTSFDCLLSTSLSEKRT